MKSIGAKKHFLIVGAGAVGLSCARSALATGHRVTVLEQGPVPNPHAASYDHHRMIRYQYGDSIAYTRMVGDAFGAWERLWVDLGKRHFYRTGTLGVSIDDNDYVARSAKTMTAAGLPYEWLDAMQISQRCPQFKLPSEAHGLLSGAGGVLFADRIVDALCALVRERGGILRANTPVVEIDTAQSTVTLANGERVHGDAVIVTTGAWLPGLMPTYRQLPTWRQAVCYVQPPAAYAQSWATGPCVSDIGVGDNYALMPVDGTGLKFGSGAHRRAGAPTDGFDAPQEEGHQVIAHFAPYLHDAEQYLPIRMAVGYYVKDKSERFNVQRYDNTVVVTNCDGQMFKFSSLMGERVVSCLNDEIAADALQRWAAGTA